MYFLWGVEKDKLFLVFNGASPSSETVFNAVRQTPVAFRTLSLRLGNFKLQGYLHFCSLEDILEEFGLIYLPTFTSAGHSKAGTGFGRQISPEMKK